MEQEPKNDMKAQVKRELKDAILSMALVKRADKKQFGGLQTSLKNSFLLGNNEYPTTVGDVLKVLNNYEPETERTLALPVVETQTTTETSPTPGVSFFQTNQGQQV